MTENTATDVMRRKAGAGRPAPEIGRMTTTRAWKVALPRAALDTLGVQASLLRVDESRVVATDLPGLVPEHGLLTLLEGPDERFGIAVVDSPTPSGMIEATTTGRISSRPPTPRAPTRTDAIISADLLDALLEGFEAGLAEMDDPPNLAGYRYAAPLVDTRAMDMALAEGPYSVFRLTLDLGGGVRQGEVLAAFPVAPRGAAQNRDVAAFQQALAENVMAAPTDLDASLFRLQLPLRDVGRLAVGDILKVPLSALAAIEVEAGGKRVAVARLGQQGGFRAVRIASLAGACESEPEELDFEETATAPLLALPPADFGIDDDADGDPLASFGDEEPDLPDLGDLPSLDDDVGLPDLAGLPPLDSKGDDAGELADIPGLPPLAG
jgi:flagellar motor switch protein FliM